jgi:hypothetical protein
MTSFYEPIMTSLYNWHMQMSILQRTTLVMVTLVTVARIIYLNRDF